MVDFQALVGDTVLAGHIVGGIESSAANIFFVNTGTQSAASTRVFRVLLVRDDNTGVIAPTAKPHTLEVALSPNGEQLIISLDLEHAANGELNLLDSSGRLVRNLLSARMPAGAQRLHNDVRGLEPGAYLVEWLTAEGRSVVRFIR